MADKSKQDKFTQALVGKKIPILTLDNKWYRLFDENGRAIVSELENELNELLKKQGKLNTESKEIKRIKKKLMNDIVSMVDEMGQTGNKKLEDEVEQNKRLIEDCNEKLDAFQEELMDIPREIDRLNARLMAYTMEYCYDSMKENEVRIKEIGDWVSEVRVELKKNLVRKQELEYKNQEMYAYMNDIFGAEMMDLFDTHFDTNTGD